MNEELHDSHRRALLAQVGSMFGTVALGSGVAQAEMQTNPSIPPPLPASFGKQGIPAGEPGVIDARAPFDLSVPMQNWIAMIKSTNNLVGARTYVPMFMRVFVCPENRPSTVLYSSFGLWTWQLVKPDRALFPNAGPNDVVQHALYTGTIGNPQTLQPTRTLRNPVTGAVVETRDS